MNSWNFTWSAALAAQQEAEAMQQQQKRQQKRQQRQDNGDDDDGEGPLFGLVFHDESQSATASAGHEGPLGCGAGLGAGMTTTSTTTTTAAGNGAAFTSDDSADILQVLQNWGIGPPTVGNDDDDDGDSSESWHTVGPASPEQAASVDGLVSSCGGPELRLALPQKRGRHEVAGAGIGSDASDRSTVQRTSATACASSSAAASAASAAAPSQLALPLVGVERVYNQHQSHVAQAAATASRRKTRARCGAIDLTGRVRHTVGASKASASAAASAASATRVNAATAAVASPTRVTVQLDAKAAAAASPTRVTVRLDDKRGELLPGRRRLKSCLKKGSPGSGMHGQTVVPTEGYMACVAAAPWAALSPAGGSPSLHDASLQDHGMDLGLEAMWADASMTEEYEAASQQVQLQLEQRRQEEAEQRRAEAKTVSFARDVKQHDGLLPKHALFDTLIWDYFSGDSTKTMANVQHLAREGHMADMLALTRDFIRRIRYSSTGMACVLPCGGGLGSKLAVQHVEHLVTLCRLLQTMAHSPRYGSARAKQPVASPVIKQEPAAGTTIGVRA